VAIAAGVAALAAACSSTVTTTPAPPPPAGTAPGTTAAPPAPVVARFPLTGAPATDAAKAGRVALVVKIDNVDSTSRPQAGINQADIIFEEKIEGPYSRFAAVFQSQDAALLGPVRSGRSTDVAIASELHHPLYAFSGANLVTIKELRAAPLVDIGYDTHPTLYDRKPGRVVPDNVFTSTDRLRALTPDGAQAPEPLFTYKDPATPVQGPEIASVGYDFGGGASGQPVSYRWDAGRHGWVRSQRGTVQVDTDGVALAPANLVVQFVPYVDTGLVDVAKNPVPEAQLVGSGTAWVFEDGRAVKASWSKPALTTVTSFTGSDGQPVALDPGQTLVALVPVGGNFKATTAAGAPL
jgi:hypothetical protein